MTITLAVVAYNEERYLPRLLADVRAQTYPHDRIEVLFVDSASTDGTRAVMESFAEEGGFAGVRICENPARRLAPGCNVAIREFSTDALVRVDAHARIPADFIAQCVAAMEGRYTADGEGVSAQPEDVVGGARPTLVESDGRWKRMLWMAEESLFGSSVSGARRGGLQGTDKSGSETEPDRITVERPKDRSYVNSIFHVCYRRAVAEKLMGFREDLGRTEDNEFYYRLRKNGYRIYRSPGIYSEQYIRPSLRKMLKQKYGNGYWIGRTLGIVPGCISPYHLVPFAFLVAMLGTSVLTVLGYPWFLRIMAGLYGSVAILMSIYSAFSLQRRGEWVPMAAVMLPVVFFLLHIVYGTGTLVGLLSIPFGRKNLDPRFRKNRKQQNRKQGQ